MACKLFCSSTSSARAERSPAPPLARPRQPGLQPRWLQHRAAPALGCVRSRTRLPPALPRARPRLPAAESVFPTPRRLRLAGSASRRAGCRPGRVPAAAGPAPSRLRLHHPAAPRPHACVGPPVAACPVRLLYSRAPPAGFPSRLVPRAARPAPALADSPTTRSARLPADYVLPRRLPSLGNCGRLLVLEGAGCPREKRNMRSAVKEKKEESGGRLAPKKRNWASAKRSRKKEMCV